MPPLSSPFVLGSGWSIANLPSHQDSFHPRPHWPTKSTENYSLFELWPNICPFVPNGQRKLLLPSPVTVPFFLIPIILQPPPSLYYLFILSCPGCLMGLWAIGIWFCGGWVLFVLVKKFAAMETDVSILTHHSFFYFLIFCTILKISYSNTSNTLHFFVFYKFNSHDLQ